MSALPPDDLALHFSPAAIAEIERLRRRSTHPDAPLRLDVVEGGCCGIAYDLSFTPETTAPKAVAPESDRGWRGSCGGIPVAIAPAALPLVNGLVLDYSEDLMGGGFRFQNPNARQTCSCSASFSV